MTRHEIRRCIFCLLFQSDFYGEEDFAEQADNFLQEQNLSEKNEDEIRRKVLELLAHLPEIDKQISANTNGWKIERIGRADLTIMRLAVYEARYDEDVPVGVAINEAVELAKEYGSDDNSSSFVNGVLGKIVNE